VTEDRAAILAARQERARAVGLCGERFGALGVCTEKAGHPPVAPPHWLHAEEVDHPILGSVLEEPWPVPRPNREDH